MQITHEAEANTLFLSFEREVYEADAANSAENACY
jgi:hypothetical protein